MTKSVSKVETDFLSPELFVWDTSPIAVITKLDIIE